MPLISVIVPVYKVEQYLDECVQSIVDQTYNNLEIILVDDGSPDKCPTMCDEWAKKDSRVVVIHKDNGGLSSARNAGMDIAQGEYIGFVDSDDVIHDKMYENLLSGFTSQNNVAITAVRIFRFTDVIKDTLYNASWYWDNNHIIDGISFSKECIKRECSFTVWNKLYRHDLLKNIRFKEGRNNEDTLFMYEIGKVLSISELIVCELPLNGYCYREREGSICNSIDNPLYKDVIFNLEYMICDCDNNRKDLLLELNRCYIQTLFDILESITLKTNKRKIDFVTYQRKLKKVKFEHIRKTMSIKNMIYIYSYKYAPFLRKIVLSIR